MIHSNNAVETGEAIVMTPDQLRDFAVECVNAYIASGQTGRPKFLFNNKTLQEYLGVNHKLLATFRNCGYLGYSQIGNKFFYTEEDVNQLLQSNYYKAFRLSERS